MHQVKVPSRRLFSPFHLPEREGKQQSAGARASLHSPSLSVTPPPLPSLLLHPPDCFPPSTAIHLPLSSVYVYASHSSCHLFSFLMIILPLFLSPHPIPFSNAYAFFHLNFFMFFLWSFFSRFSPFSRIFYSGVRYLFPSSFSHSSKSTLSFSLVYVFFLHFPFLVLFSFFRLCFYPRRIHHLISYFLHIFIFLIPSFFSLTLTSSLVFALHMFLNSSLASLHFLPFLPLFHSPPSFHFSKRQSHLFGGYCSLNPSQV